ncbi:MAG: hypothetical protein P4M08_01020 [Oligoflexia bacterium]|nr:hypothetical protein [Oligoflexia bacterium]
MYRKAFIAILLILGVSMPILSFDYGLTTDEFGHNLHGHMILDYFLGRSDDAGIRPPLNPTPPLTSGSFTPSNDPAWHTTNFFGGFFDLVAAVAQKFLPFGPYETRHLVNSLFGWLGIAMTGMLAYDLAGWRAGVLGLLFAAFCPRLFGHSMNNPKDIPFAALTACALYEIMRFLREFPRVRWYRPLLIAIPTALATDVRIGGLLLICYLWLFTGIESILKLRHRDYRVLIPLGVAFVTGVAAYFGSGIFWPSVHHAPLTAPLDSLYYATHFDFFDSFELFDGRWMHRWEIPWYYLPKLTLITTPLFVSAGLLLLPWALLPQKGKSNSTPRAAYLLLFAFVFPIAFIIYKKANVYDQGRHILFTLPPLLALCAVAFENLLRRISSRPKSVRLAAWGMLGVFLLEPATWTVRTHPLEVFYFSPLIGGVQGAFKKYELDYWENGYRPAVEWIQKNVPPGTPEKPVRVRAWYGEPLCAQYYLEKRPGYRFVLAEEDSPNWDYSIVNGTQAKHNPPLLLNWPPADTVYEVKVAGVPITAVVRNPTPTWEQSLAKHRQALASSQDPVTHLNFGLELLNHQLPAEAIQEFEASLKLKPKDAIALNDLGIAYGALGQWGKQVLYCSQALDAQPDFQLAKNNLAWAKEEIAKRTLAGASKK